MAINTPIGVSWGKGKSMKSTRALTRLGLLAVGLGVGAAFASMPAIASADTSSDWLSAVDSLFSGAAPAADAATGLNVAISYDGASLFQIGTAHASSGSDGDFAIAYGADSSASATGTDSYATVYGDGSSAVAGGAGSSTDTALVVGDGSSAFAGGANSSQNLAFIYGNESTAGAGGYGDNPGTQDIAGIVGNDDGAFAGSNATAPGDFDIAYVESNDLGTANATGTSDLIEILKQYDNWGGVGATSAASESANPLSDLLSGSSGAAADASNAWTELLSAFDGGSAAADASNLWTELASLF
jgi:hypothetical protein